jgi:hypothetical protein
MKKILSIFLVILIVCESGCSSTPSLPMPDGRDRVPVNTVRGGAA